MTKFERIVVEALLMILYGVASIIGLQLRGPYINPEDGEAAFKVQQSIHEGAQAIRKVLEK